MTNAQTIIDGLLTGYVQQYELPDEAQAVLNRVRERVVSSADAKKDIELLYGAKDCEDLALALMWVMERVDRDPGRTEPTESELETVQNGLTLALTRMGMLGNAAEEDQPVPEEGAGNGAEIISGMQPEEPLTMPEQGAVPETGDSASEPEQSSAETTPEVPAPALADDAGGSVAEPEEPPASTAAPAGGTTDASEIGSALEKLLEALQSGSEESGQMLSSLRADFAACQADASLDASLRSYAESVDDFLGYVQENDLLDDVRVMNFFTNVQEPYAQWLESSEGERAGILEQAIDFLSDFRAMFE